MQGWGGDWGISDPFRLHVVRNAIVSYRSPSPGVTSGSTIDILQSGGGGGSGGEEVLSDPYRLLELLFIIVSISKPRGNFGVKNRYTPKAGVGWG